MNRKLPQLHAVIGVRYSGNRTFYVKRSQKMGNYPGVWSLPSIQFDHKQTPDPTDLSNVRPLMEKLSRERLGGVPIVVRCFLTAGNSAESPVGKHVFLYLYEIELPREPILNPDYYTEAAWLTARGYEQRSAGEPCGLCLRLWSDYAWMSGITDRPFVAQSVGSNA